MAKGVVPVRLSDEMLARIDGVRGDVNRSEFVRGAIEAALNGGVNNSLPVSEKPGREMSARELSDPGFPKSKPAKKSPVPKLRPDDEALLAFLGGVSSTDAKRACEALGWLPGRYAKAERALLASGRAAVRMGLLVKV